MEDQLKIDANFFQLVVSLQMSAMHNMGKMASPVTGEIERNLDQAKISIDMLSMLSEKTAGNLTEEEKGLIDKALYELRMNFIDESKKDEETADKPDGEKEEPISDGDDTKKTEE